MAENTGVPGVSVTEGVTKKGPWGALPGNTNALKAGIFCPVSRLPRSCSYLERRLRAFRDTIALLVNPEGELTPSQQLQLDAILNYTLVRDLCLRYARIAEKEKRIGEKERGTYMGHVIRCMEQRNRMLCKLLGEPLDASPDIASLLYSHQPQPADAAAGLLRDVEGPGGNLALTTPAPVSDTERVEGDTTAAAGASPL